jgi:hypothetical protein
MKRTGYREMLRDRCPSIVNYALKWQKAKEKWIEHAYCYFIKIVGEERDIDDKLVKTASDNKRAVITVLLGLKKGKPKHFDFNKTIDWDNLTDEEKIYWNRVSSWVKWFRTNYAYIENMCNISKQIGKTDEEIKIEIIKAYLMDLMPNPKKSNEEKQAQYMYIDNLADFLIGCSEGKY